LIGGVGWRRARVEWCGGRAGSDGNGLEIDALCRGDGREEIDWEFSAAGAVWIVAKRPSG
jgi:hypothetical protein